MTDIRTPYGDIHYGGPCEDDYPNMVTYDQPRMGGLVLILQSPAMRAFKNAEDRIQPRRVRRLNNPRGHKDFRGIVVLAGTNRTCETQRRLYASDSGRYAHPDVTGHTRGIAIDVSQAQSSRRLRAIHRALLAEGWEQTRPDDEPWHYSYGVRV